MIIYMIYASNIIESCKILRVEILYKWTEGGQLQVLAMLRTMLKRVHPARGDFDEGISQGVTHISAESDRTASASLS